MIAFNLTVSNPFAMNGSYTPYIERRGSLKKFSWCFQVYRYTYIVADLEARLTTQHCHVKATLLGYTIFFSIGRQNEIKKSN